ASSNIIVKNSSHLLTCKQDTALSLPLLQKRSDMNLFRQKTCFVSCARLFHKSKTWHRSQFKATEASPGACALWPDHSSRLL
ncbi:hypothetical protein NDU88_002767, partial [Pleurodeles waltl]